MISRRELLQHSATLLSLTPLRLLASCVHSPTSIEVEPATNTICIDLRNPEYAVLRVIQGSQYVSIQHKLVSLIVTRVSPDQFDAVSSECTHHGCDVNLYDPLVGGLSCDCHHSFYAPYGTVLGGPAPKPLPKAATTFDGVNILKIDISTF